MRNTAALLVGSLITLGAGVAQAQLFQEDFNAFDGSGFETSPTAGQLDSNVWSTTGFGTNADPGGSCNAGDCARGSSSGGVTSGGVYAFEVATGDFALGVQPAGSDFTPGTFDLTLTNTSGSDAPSLEVSYDVYVFNDQGRSNTLSLIVDGTTYDTFTSAEGADAAPAWVSTSVSVNVPVAVADGASLVLSFSGDDSSGGGSRDEFAIDNIVISAGQAPPGVPLLPAAGLSALVAGLAGLGLRSMRRSPKGR